MLTTTGTTLASSFPEFQFNGDVKVHYRWNTADGSSNTEGNKVWFRLNAKSEVAKNVDLYSRLSIQRAGQFGGRDYDSTQYNTNDTAASIDRFGFVVKGKGFNYTIGRQDLFLGQGLLMDSTSYMGINRGAFDGIAIAGKTGATNLKVVVGKAWQNETTQDVKLYAVDASYGLTKNLTLGATAAKVSNRVDAEKDLTFYAFNTAYTTGKATLFGEYGKSNANEKNKGYAFGMSYGIDEKNSVFAIYSKVDTYANLIQNMTMFDDSGKGMYYGFGHKISKDTKLDIFYKDMKTIDSGEKYTSFRTTLTYKF